MGLINTDASLLNLGEVQALVRNEIQFSATQPGLPGGYGASTFGISQYGAFGNPSQSVRRYSTKKTTVYPCVRAEKLKVKTVGAFWKSLLTGQKLAWKTLALNSPYFDRFGNLKIISGYQMFLKVNRALIHFGEAAMLPDAPVSYDPPGAEIPVTFFRQLRPYYGVPVLLANFTAEANKGIIITGINGHNRADVEIQLRAKALFAGEAQPVNGADIAVWYSWKWFYNVVAGVCDPNDEAAYRYALNMAATKRKLTMEVKTVNLLTGAYLSTLHEDEAY